MIDHNYKYPEIPPKQKDCDSCGGMFATSRNKTARLMKKLDGSLLWMCDYCANDDMTPPAIAEEIKGCPHCAEVGDLHAPLCCEAHAREIK